MRGGEETLQHENFKWCCRRRIILRVCSCPLSGESGTRLRCPIAPLCYCTALSFSRSPALFPAPLREISAALWSAELSLVLGSLILAVHENKPRLLPRLFCKVNILRNYFRSEGHFETDVRQPHQQQSAEAQRTSPTTPPPTPFYYPAYILVLRAGSWNKIRKAFSSY